MSELTIHPRTGVGDLLILKDFLSSDAGHDLYSTSIMGCYSSINLHFSTNDQSGRSVDYNVFRDQLVGTLYSEDIFNTINTEERAAPQPLPLHLQATEEYFLFYVDRQPVLFTPTEAAKRLNFKKTPNILCDDHNYKEDYGENYVVLSTRVRDLRVDTGLVEQILLALSKRYNKILIIGENQRGNVMKMPNIYGAIIGLSGGKTPYGLARTDKKDRSLSFFGTKIIDLTTGGLSLEGFKKENAITRDAAMTVILGWGGNMCRQIYINNNNMACVYAAPLLHSHPIMARLKETSHHCYPDNPQGYQDFFKRIVS